MYFMFSREYIVLELLGNVLTGHLQKLLEKHKHPGILHITQFAQDRVSSRDLADIRCYNTFVLIFLLIGN